MLPGEPLVAGRIAHALELGQPEGQIERLARVQARVAERHVADVQLVLEHGLGAAQALGDVLARELDVDAAGRRALVLPLARAAAAVGADGIIVEAHPRPEEALCDGPQQIPADEFGEFAREVTEIVTLMGKQVG